MALELFAFLAALLVSLAWRDAFMTGMLAALFVAFRPQWLAIWSDALYLKNRFCLTLG